MNTKASAFRNIPVLKGDCGISQGLVEIRETDEEHEQQMKGDNNTNKSQQIGISKRKKG